MLLAGLALAAFAGAASAQTAVPAQGAAPPPPLSAEDARTVYAELVQTHDGLVYSYFLARFSTQDKVRAAWEQMQQGPARVLRFDKLYRDMKPRSGYLFVFEPALREKLVTLYPGERSGPVPLRQGWAIAELIATRTAPPPTLQQAESHLAGLVAAGILPSAEALRSDPDLRRRTLVNNVRSVDDLRALPAEVSVDTRLSSLGTLLERALVLRRPDFVEALLKRGADPDKCARKFCPLQLAVYGDMRSTLELLLRSGADPNQHNPALGIMEGPLSAAAYLGDEGFVARLIEAGARPEGYGTASAPLMSASTKAHRAVAELLIAKGVDVLAVADTRPQRTALDFAERGGNADYAAWLRETMLKKADGSAAYRWQGWIEQDGTRQALDGRPVTLKRAPFRILVRMQPEATLYVAASVEPRMFDVFKAREKSNLRSNASIGFEANNGRDAYLIVYGAMKEAEGWGGSQAWWHHTSAETRFSSVDEPPEGREYGRAIEVFKFAGEGSTPEDVPVAGFKGAALYLVLGTRVNMTVAADEVMYPKTVELRFTDQAAMGMVAPGAR